MDVPRWKSPEVPVWVEATGAGLGTGLGEGAGGGHCCKGGVSAGGAGAGSFLGGGELDAGAGVGPLRKHKAQ